jgi:ornithine decarboxylase
MAASFYNFDDYSAESINRVDTSILFKKDVNHGRKLIGEAFKARIDQIDSDTCAAGEEDAFFIADMGHVYRQHLRWKTNLGRVIPHYGKFCH